MSFGLKLKKLREKKGISQSELAKRLGYQTNSYVSDVEQGKFIPSQEKLKDIARALGMRTSKIKDALLESRFEQIGINDPDFISIVKDYPRLSKQDKKAIVNSYLKVKQRRGRKKVP